MHISTVILYDIYQSVCIIIENRRQCIKDKGIGILIIDIDRL